MKKLEAKNRIIFLVETINKWNYEYYVLNNPTVSDLEYDKSLIELENLEAQYPEFILENSPTKYLGGLAENKFKKVTHKKPMLSLAKAYNYEEIKKYVENITSKLDIDDINFSVEPKIDGLSIGLIYKNKKLVQAVTRGDGIVGEVVTENVYQIENIPKVINYDNDLEVRGEVFIFKDDFEKINQKNEESGIKTYANARNIASGTLRQLDPSIVKERKLSSYLYELVEPAKHNIRTQEEALKFMQKLNIPTNPYEKVVEIEELEDEINNFAEIKKNLPYDADGLVIKLNNLEFWDKLGTTSKFPKHSIAFKYDLEFATSKIKKIFTTVGRTGKITYVANLEPVELNQTIVKAATLHNYNFIKDLNINIGDEVKIIKAGEIIPKVIDLINKNTNDTYEKVLYCPSCNSLLIEIENNVDQFCINQNCPEMNINSIYHFASRKALNIVGLGLTTVKDLYPKYIKNILDIFYLKDYKIDLMKLNRYGELKVNNLLNNIEKVLNAPFDKVLFALGIKNVGQRASKLIARKYNNFNELITDENLEKIDDIKNIGPKIVISIKEYLNNVSNINTLNKLDELFDFKIIGSDNEVSSKLSGLSFVITGKLNHPREYYIDLIEKHQGILLSAISKKTDYLIVGKEAGSKLIKAKSLNIKIISENEFMAMIEK